jgi:hypothetical protein
MPVALDSGTNGDQLALRKIRVVSEGSAQTAIIFALSWIVWM